MFQILNHNKKYKFKKGISVIEILIVVFIVSVALSGLLGVAAFSLKNSTSIKNTLEANALAQEEMEAVRNFRDGTAWAANGLGVLILDKIYHMATTTDNPSKWSFADGDENINGFKREVVLSKVYRDDNDNISQTETDDEDSNTKKVTVTVSWGNKEVELITYLTNWK